MDIETYKRIYEQQISNIKAKQRNRNLWIYGAGKGGKILLEILNRNDIDVTGFVDQNYKELSNWIKYPVVSIGDLSADVDFILLSAMNAQIGSEMLYECIKRGFIYDDIFFSVTGFEEEDDLYDIQDKDFIYRGCKVGRYSPGYQWLLSETTEDLQIRRIGRFCSINRTARIWPEHLISAVSSHLFFERPFDPLRGMCDYYSNLPKKGDKLEIGNDVWIGANVIITSSVSKIEDGSVIGAGAVVTKDVEPYAIVGGVPAKTIRYRFPEDIRKKLLAIKWWDWEPSIIKERMADFYNIEMFVEKYSL